jgi:hypothetical protein
MFTKLNSNGSSYTIPGSNTAWFNNDLTANDPSKRIFKTYDDAVSWIQANGSPSSNNLWQVNLPAGNVGTITLHSSIRVAAADGTNIEKLKSNKTFTSFMDLFDAYISGAIIEELELDNGECCAMYNCIVKDVTPASTSALYVANHTHFLSGDFENYFGLSFYCLYQDLEGNISNLTVDGSHTDVQHVDGSPYTCNILDANLKHGVFSPSNVTGNLDLTYVEIGSQIVGATGLKFSFNNCKIRATLTLNAGVSLNAFNSTFENILCETTTAYICNSSIGTLRVDNGGQCAITNCNVNDCELNAGVSLNAFNSTFENILCETTTAYIYNSHINILRVDNGGQCAINNCFVNDCYVENASTLYATNSHCYDIKVLDTSTLNANAFSYTTKNFESGCTILNKGGYYNNSLSGLRATNTQDAIDELKTMIDLL